MTGDGGATGTVGHGAAGRRGPEGPSPWGSRETLSIEVEDAGSPDRRPERAVAGSEEEHGRGLALVEAFADSWDARPHGDGLYFVLALTPPAAAERA
ncbi:hypothetical protein GCM10023224_31390 [Streptomonospora halophila]|uniref:Histidine kinase/HSP90-like ATPase domain-containing protein n=1 Tax=Streptomonospora halophila TaxID=427369 RepID=A0ABP9GJK6_9ACTN